MENDRRNQKDGFDRRAFLGLMTGALVSSGLVLSGCQAQGGTGSNGAESGLPASEPDPRSDYGIDLHVNMRTIDDYVGRSDIVYRDMRMLVDPADFEAIGGNNELASMIEGFRVVPYPYLATLPKLSVGGAYEGESLFAVEWNDDHTIASAEANYTQSMQLLTELFPQDRPVFLMCGGGSYASMTKILLTYLGWDEAKLYNMGGMWDYTGAHGIDVITYDSNDVPTYCFWRTDYTVIDFSRLTVDPDAAIAQAALSKSSGSTAPVDPSLVICH
jgi:hypothetical protein